MSEGEENFFVLVLAGWGRFLNLLFVMKDGMSSFKASTFRVGDVIGWDMD